MCQPPHNIFPLAYAEAPYRKFQEYNNMRGLTHTREGYAGIQRYPCIVWICGGGSVSYTHLDVYKRQCTHRPSHHGSWECPKPVT